jgi:tetratricopeptide (TPR) repeat protein
MHTTGRKRIYFFIISFICLFMICSGCSSKEEKRDKHLAKAKEYIAKSEFSKAVIELKNVIQLDPKNDSAYYELGETYLKLKQGNEAYQAYSSAVSINPENMNAQLKVGQILLLAKETKKAREKAELILNKTPDSIEALSLLSGVQLQENDIDSAITTLEKVARLDPKLFNTQLSLGRVYLLKGNLDQSEKAFTNAISLDPKSSVPYIALSRIYGSKGDWNKAEETLKNMLNASDSKYQDLYYLAVFYESQSKWDEAEKTYQEAVASSPSDDIASLMNLGGYYARRKLYDKSLETLNKAAAIKKDDLNVMLSIAQLHFDFDKIKESDAVLDNVLLKDKGNLSAVFLKGRIFLYKKDYTKALEQFEAVLKDKPDNYLAYYMKALCLLAKNDTNLGRESLIKAVELNPDLLDARLILAELYIRAGDKTLATEQVDAVLTRAPANERALTLKGNLRILEKDAKGSEDAFKKVVELNPNNPSGYLRLGILYNLMGKKDDSLKNLQKSLDLNPLQTDALGLIVSMYLKDKKYNDAMSLCERQKEKAKESTSTLAVIAYLEGNVSIAQKDNKKAKEYFNEAIKIDPNVLASYISLAKIYIDEKNFNEAISQYKSIVEKNPSYISGYMAIGTIYDQINDNKNAEIYYRKALEINPKFGPAANNLAWKLAASGGNIDEALNLAQVAKEQLPKNASVMDTLGWIYYLKGSYMNAISELQDSLELAPENAEVTYHLGMAYYKSNQTSNAKDYLKKALELKADFTGADEARRVLKELGSK